jgi:hypothetical protein
MFDTRFRVFGNASEAHIQLSSLEDGTTYYPTSLDDIELYSNLKAHLLEVSSGELKLSPWSNPLVSYQPLNQTNSLLFCYFTLLGFLRLSSARDMWASIPIKSKLSSYLKDRLHYSCDIMAYKVAILKCLHKCLGTDDIVHIQDVFEECGLSRSNYVLYVFFLCSGDYMKLKMDTKFSLNLRSLREEADNFINAPQIARLTNFQARSKLSFVVKSSQHDFNDFATELTMQTLIAYRLARPVASIPYSENYARRCLTNAATRIIFAHTHYPSHQSMWQTESGGFVIRDADISTVDMKPSSVTYDPNYSAYDTTMLFNEDAMIEFLDSKRHEKTK